jgi:lipid II:glycine glycyltransferase (peptidoglycan interpeptide bridge formation enzyme)
MSGGSSIQVKHLNILDPSVASEWDNLVQSHPDATVFHSAAWGQVIHDTYGHKPFYVCFSDADKAVALVPLIEVLSPLTGRRAVCLPFSDGCGPLLFQEGASSVVKESLAKLARERAWKYFEIRGGELLDESATPTVSFYGHTLQLSSDPEISFKRFEEATRRAVRRAIKNNLAVEVSQDAATVREFYQLQIQTRKKHGIPPQPFSFFANIHKNLIETGRGFTILVRSEGRTAAGAIFLRNATRAIYKFAASDPELAKSRGNNLVLWEGIRHLSRSGCELLHFGRSSLDHDGLRRFKLSWGTEEQMIRYCRFDARQGRWVTAPQGNGNGIHQHIFRHLPLALNRLAGAILYPHLD